MPTAPFLSGRLVFDFFRSPSITFKMNEDHSSSCLIKAYTCSHYKIITVDEAHAQDLRPLLSSTNPPYIKLTVPCGKRECQYVSSGELRERIANAVVVSLEDLSTAATAYANTGMRFHNVSVAVRAKEAQNHECSLAYRQYGGLETRNWIEDPFFGPLHQVCESLNDVIDLMESDTGSEIVQDALEKINIARALLEGSVKAAEIELFAGVEALEEVAAKGKVREKSALTWPARKSPETKCKPCVSDTAMRKYAVEWAMYNSWRRRVEGLIFNLCGDTAVVKVTQFRFQPE